MSKSQLPPLPRRVETDRLVLRRYEQADAPIWYDAALRNQNHLSVFEGGNVMMTLTDPQQTLEVIGEIGQAWDNGQYWFIGLFDREGGEWAGQLYVSPTNRELPEFTIGYVADVDHEGRGLVSEAVRAELEVLFTTMGAHRVVSDCNEYNDRSWRLLERCGFTREGHLRENRRNPDGTVHGDFLYGLLRCEWVAGRPAGHRPADGRPDDRSG